MAPASTASAMARRTLASAKGELGSALLGMSPQMVRPWPLVLVSLTMVPLAVEPMAIRSEAMVMSASMIMSYSPAWKAEDRVVCCSTT